MAKSQKSFYAVAKGVRPGLYHSWSGVGGAEEQVRGFLGAVYKGFTTLEDALDYLHAHGIQTEEYANHQPRERYNDGRIHIFTDGGAVNNPGPGGYGVVLIFQGRRKELSQGFQKTTNNRMELRACIAALESLKKSAAIVIYSDSRYVVDNISKGHAHRWRSNGWITLAKKPVENADLWRLLLDLVDRYNPEFVWVKGHGGASENERCDQLAQAAARGDNLIVDKGYGAEENLDIFA
jgi:ribonuclease HI